jgi:tRNA-Thr(GGU) m(6)t(6)A37 methyltransferase TsaA
MRHVLIRNPILALAGYGATVGFPVFTFQPIGYVRSRYTDTKEIPKGLGAKHEAEGILEIRREFEAGLTDIEGFSHLYVIWAFDRSAGFELLGTPPSDNRPHGVFATRSPRRPNAIGLTVVELLHRDGANLQVRGIDMLEGTPILDIKPYLSNVPPERLRRGWLAEAEARSEAEAVAASVSWHADASADLHEASVPAEYIKSWICGQKKQSWRALLNSPFQRLQGSVFVGQTRERRRHVKRCHINSLRCFL